MRDNGGAAACGGAAGAAGARDGCALFRFASFLNNAALAHAIGALWPALCPRARWAGPPVCGVVQPFYYCVGGRNNFPAECSDSSTGSGL